MASYEEARLNEFTAAATKTITGVSLEPAEQSPLISSVGRIPVKLCICVTEPCPCDGPIIWMEEGDILQRVTTERRTTAGEELQDFKIKLDATVLVESVVRMKAGDLGRGPSHFTGLNRFSHLPTKGCGCGRGKQARALRSPGETHAHHYQSCRNGVLYDVYVEILDDVMTFYSMEAGSSC